MRPLVRYGWNAALALGTGLASQAALALDGRCRSHSAWSATLSALPLALGAGAVGALAAVVLWSATRQSIRALSAGRRCRSPMRWKPVACAGGLLCLLPTWWVVEQLIVTCF